MHYELFYFIIKLSYLIKKYLHSKCYLLKLIMCTSLKICTNFIYMVCDLRRNGHWLKWFSLGKKIQPNYFFSKILNWTKLNERNQLISLVGFGFIFVKIKYVQFDQWAFSWVILDKLGINGQLLQFILLSSYTWFSLIFIMYTQFCF